jgi:ATP-dependent Clp protease protease subunit
MKKIEEFNAQDRIDLKFLESSVRFLYGEIEETNVNELIKWIVYENLTYKDPKTLTLYINSQGGDLYQAFALIDMIKTSHHKVRTVGVGSVMSSAFLIFASGTAGERYTTKNTSFMSHQFTENIDGKYHDLKSTMKEGDLCNQRMVNILREATNLTPAKIRSKFLSSSDSYYNSSEMIDLNIADHIL